MRKYVHAGRQGNIITHGDQTRMAPINDYALLYMQVLSMSEAQLLEIPNCLDTAHSCFNRFNNPHAISLS